MSQWPFVAAAYAIAIVATAALLVWAYLSMRSAEGKADKARSRE
jgi:hypothetical protein